MNRDYPLESIILPMGATTVKDGKKMEELWDSDEYICEEKYDGSRYLAIGGRFFSRRVSVVDKLPVEKTDNVPHLRRLLSFNKNLILDGEVYLPNKTSNEVTSIMGSLPERAIKLQEEGGYLLYMVYDILRDLDGNWLLDKPWKERRAILKEVVYMLNLKTNLIKMSTVVTEHKREFCAEVMARGGEGVMLKNINGKYFPDKKPRWNWVKVKQEITADVIITGFKPAKREYEGKELESWMYWENLDKENPNPVVKIEGTFDKKIGLDEHGNVVYVRRHMIMDTEDFTEFEPVSKFHYNDWIGSIEFSQFDSHGTLVPMGECSGISEDLRQGMSKDPDKYIGQVIEISAMQRTNDGYFRHPQFLRFRDDKNPRDCVVGEF